MTDGRRRMDVGLPDRSPLPLQGPLDRLTQFICLTELAEAFEKRYGPAPSPIR